jgi:hypothetical protein
LNYSEPDQDRKPVESSLAIAEKILNRINERLVPHDFSPSLKRGMNIALVSVIKRVGRSWSQSLRTSGLDKGELNANVEAKWTTELTYSLRRLDLTEPTRYMGARKLLRDGLVMKAKSGRKLHAFLCSDILVLTDESVKALYRMVSV